MSEIYQNSTARIFSWKDWVFVCAVTLTACVLGFVGFTKYYLLLGQAVTVFDISYNTLNLFVLQSYATLGNIPWQLEIARWLAPIPLGYTAIKQLCLCCMADGRYGDCAG